MMRLNLHLSRSIQKRNFRRNLIRDRNEFVLLCIKDKKKSLELNKIFPNFKFFYVIFS